MECQNLIYLSKQDMLVPCGKCAFCCATKRSDWALRLHYEGRKHLVKRFLTLTYADAHLHWKNGTSQLLKKHLQLWFKRVRKAGYKVRYFAVGEYGSKTFRPHYHVLLFGQVPEDVIRKSWTYGHVHIGQVTEASVMYCLGYIINGKGWKMRVKRTPPFSIMSRKPGLGANYLTPAMIAWHKSDRRNYAVLDGQKRHLPRYYKLKIFSKIDQIRIAHRDQKMVFRKMVEWVRSPQMMKHRDPMAYRKDQLQRLAWTIKSKCKINLTI